MGEETRRSTDETVEEATSGRASEHERQVVEERSERQGTEERVLAGTEHRVTGDVRPSDNAQEEIERERRGIEEDPVHEPRR